MTQTESGFTFTNTTKWKITKGVNQGLNGVTFNDHIFTSIPTCPILIINFIHEIPKFYQYLPFGLWLDSLSIFILIQ